jgi:hypothetical protein
MNIPQPNYIEDKNGKETVVQLSLTEWENFVKEFEQMKNMLNLKSKLERAFREVRQIKRGEKQGTTLEDFLNEL